MILDDERMPQLRFKGFFWDLVWGNSLFPMIAQRLFCFCLCLGFAFWLGLADGAIASTLSPLPLPLPSAITQSNPPDQTQQEAVNLLFEKAFEATSRADFANAETYWTSILEIYPKNAAVWSNRGNARVSQRKLEDALTDYNQSIALAPDQPDPYLNRGAAL
jgi:tetratricopeptide (TPR) repeat protein